MSAALKSGSRCRALVLARPTVTPWHTHTPGLTAPRALQALRSAGSPVSPPGGRLCSSPAHMGLPQHQGSLLPPDPGSQGPLEPWAQPCPHSAGRPLPFAGTIRKQQGLQKSVPLHPHALHTHARSGQETAVTAPQGWCCWERNQAGGEARAPHCGLHLLALPAAISAHRGPEQQTTDSAGHPEHCVVLFSCS